MEENKIPKKEDLLKVDFDKLSEKEQDKFYEDAYLRIDQEYGKILTPEIKSTTHTLVLKNGLGGIIKKPNARVTAKVFNKLSSFNGEIDTTGAGLYILDNCWICGDEEIMKNEDFKLFAGMQAVNLVEIMEGRIKKN